MGLRRESNGPSALLVLIWIRMIQLFAPPVFVVEEAPQFARKGLSFIASSGILGHLYTFSHAVLNPRSMGLPVSRLRFYVLGTKCKHCVLSVPLSRFAALFPRNRCVVGRGSDFFFQDLPPSQLTESTSRALAGYRCLFNDDDDDDDDDVFDLTQTPTERPRRLLKDGALQRLTRNCKLCSINKRRYLSGLESLIAQGWALDPFQRGYSKTLREHCLTLSDPCVRQIAGNGMHCASVGSVLMWAVAHINFQTTSACFGPAFGPLPTPFAEAIKQIRSNCSNAFAHSARPG